ncbi:MAG: AAA family ATPase [Desulfobacterales bacterium]|uniref:endopeptidase La n=1 Tax=Candidatus Desulfatibia profunda TaxID=2841695 RepID=A0A8J6NNN0_9BACT|nr:AAA family ATPase [Candidatus Desulfatibia profunda]MBL7178855.1 AAA family ATPase [Desulfobacterales bacterium]
MVKKYELSAADLRCICDPKTFNFKNTSEIEPLSEVIGQQRAVHAIEFGLNMKSPGYNIFVTGIEGTGKSTIIQDIVNEHAADLQAPVDWCLINNFRDEYRPKAIAVPTGKATRFSKTMNKLIDDLKDELPKAFEHESYQEKQAKIQKEYSDRQRNILQKLEKSAAKNNIQINRTKTGYQTIPIVKDKTISPEEFLAMPKDKRAKIEENIRSVQPEIDATIREVNKLHQAMSSKIEKLMQEVTLFVVKGRIDIIKDEYKGCKDILAYLNDVQADILEYVKDFIAAPPEKSPFEGLMFPAVKPSFQRYDVNVLVEQKSLKGAPVIFETNPTYHNVFGQIEKRAHMGTLTTDFTMVQAGSLLTANGGYLIMEIESILMNPYVWEALKRALQNKLLHIEDVASGLGFGTSSLRPEPIPLDVKVILLGSYYLFELLQNYDSKFNKIFKVRADFDHEVEKSEDTIQKYSQFIARACKQEGLLPLTPKGVAAIVEFGEKYVAKKNKLSIRFGPIMGVLKEADYWARKHKARLVSDKHVIKAFQEYRFRYNLYEEKIHESYVDNTIMIDVEGEAVGQVNALSVYQIGDFSFGRPSRITAETYMGKQGVINIEREAKLSGKTHDKGVLILSGYLGRTFAQNYPLSLSISITFEQSYGGIDGDSASSTELYAIISSLADIPIRQGIAVTGSVNQKGKIQAIGGVNQKIEGFFEVCKSKGLTGRQGVMIPRSNVNNLMLKKEVVDTVKKGRFHIYCVETVAEGIEILTGLKAGTPDKEGIYPAKTVFGRVQEKLKKYLQRSYRLKKELEPEDDDA